MDRKRLRDDDEKKPELDIKKAKSDVSLIAFEEVPPCQKCGFNESIERIEIGRECLQCGFICTRTKVYSRAEFELESINAGMKNLRLCGFQSHEGWTCISTSTVKGDSTVTCADCGYVHGHVINAFTSPYEKTISTVVANGQSVGKETNFQRFLDGSEDDNKLFLAFHLQSGEMQLIVTRRNTIIASHPALKDRFGAIPDHVATTAANLYTGYLQMRKTIGSRAKMGTENLKDQHLYSALIMNGIGFSPIDYCEWAFCEREGDCKSVLDAMSGSLNLHMHPPFRHFVDEFIKGYNAISEQGLKRFSPRGDHFLLAKSFYERLVKLTVQHPKRRDATSLGFEMLEFWKNTYPDYFAAKPVVSFSGADQGDQGDVNNEDDTRNQVNWSVKIEPGEPGDPAGPDGTDDGTANTDAAKDGEPPAKKKKKPRKPKKSMPRIVPYNTLVSDFMVTATLVLHWTWLVAGRDLFLNKWVMPTPSSGLKAWANRIQACMKSILYGPCGNRCVQQVATSVLVSNPRVVTFVKEKIRNFHIRRHKKPIDEKTLRHFFPLKL
jgi:hypothetical protein